MRHISSRLFSPSSHPVTLVVCLISQCIYTPVCPLPTLQNVDLYSVPIISKPVYCDIVYDMIQYTMLFRFWTLLTILLPDVLCFVTLITWFLILAWTISASDSDSGCNIIDLFVKYQTPSTTETHSILRAIYYWKAGWLLIYKHTG